MKKIEHIVNLDIIKLVNKTLQVKAALGGRRALALAGITFNRPFDNEDDHDLVVKKLSIYQKSFLAINFLEKANGPYQDFDEEETEKTNHYYFWSETGNGEYDTHVRNCLFTNKDLVTTMCKGILIVDPEQILYYKKQYTEVSDKHKRDILNMNDSIYKLKKV